VVGGFASRDRLRQEEKVKYLFESDCMYLHHLIVLLATAGVTGCAKFLHDDDINSSRRSSFEMAEVQGKNLFCIRIALPCSQWNFAVLHVSLVQTMY